ncbi:helix-turn-helix domain-containing protein [Streptomyces sp. WMMC1477]|uniref:helix-turn-helix domain-containing protein n=1 Tax=Streptomyces sp. WMMC1477 TaxID=3015155 RepID=UPI0022B6E72C|nr:helix-turn-helix transcriptional regulator [Streptomyces sp. WMMC1477]MCZ7432202.1 helix-turn-helix transcriptional regulator [Streptomyces sp. WMMC1477]
MCEEADEEGSPEPAAPCERGLTAYREALADGTVSGGVPGCLLRLGLLVPHEEKPGAFTPVPPYLAAHRLSQPVEQSITSGRQRLAALQDSFADVRALWDQEVRESLAPVRVLHGQQVIVGVVRQRGESCRTEFCYAQPQAPRPPEVLKRNLAPTLGLLERGVRVRGLYQHSVRSHEPTLEFMDEVQRHGGEFRTLDELFDRVYLFDRSFALIPDHTAEPGARGLAIEHAGVVGFVGDVFDHAWQRAEPVDFDTPLGRPEPLTDAKQLTVLRLMVEGHTDTAVAARLGMSTRTVANYVRRAAEEYGSRSRAQLAYLLAKSGRLS